jgi:hypothetical protein
MIGFLTVCQQNDGSVVGGYLVLNAAGRPLEFHCTAPVRPSRAQEILYGPTLKPFLYGEQIGRALVGKATSAAAFVCTDSEPVLALRDLTDTPLILVATDAEPETSEPPCATAREVRIDEAHPVLLPAARRTLTWFSLGAQRAASLAVHVQDCETVRRHWQTQLEGLDLCEPFARIREALQEAQRTPAR